MASRFRISLFELFGLVTLVGIACAAMLNANTLLLHIVGTAFFAWLFVSIVIAITAPTSARQRFCVGFSVAALLHFLACGTFLANKAFPTDAILAGLYSITPKHTSTTEWYDADGIQAMDWDDDDSWVPAVISPRGDEAFEYPRRSVFVATGRIFAAALIGIAGGWVCRSLLAGPTPASDV